MTYKTQCRNGYTAPRSTRRRVPRAPHAPHVPAAAIDSPSRGRRRHRRRRRRRCRGIPASAAVAAVPSRRARPRAEIAERIRAGRAVLPPPHTELELGDRSARVCVRKQPNVLPREWSAAVCHETAEGGRKQPRATESGERWRGCWAGGEGREDTETVELDSESERPRRSWRAGPRWPPIPKSRTAPRVCFYEGVNPRHRGACLGRTERSPIQVLELTLGGRRQLPELAEARPVRRPQEAKALPWQPSASGNSRSVSGPSRSRTSSAHRPGWKTETERLQPRQRTGLSSPPNALLWCLWARDLHSGGAHTH
ncbi:uncharacterized protein LOC128119345 [Peromyscus californicus insignis]|uniref:uncharacterized protein LOC128119345 n=1 Tax=Peromyscus californicus insignis TaxID=564181 RepID=UPI0022A772EA|nr:uncharacterized protein LOC128119345 [Peromyscus californicus insignis]